MRTVITIDGLAGTGKTSLARQLAERLQFQHLNTGILYRSLALLTLGQDLSEITDASIAPLLSSVKMSVEKNKQGQSVVVLPDRVEPLTYEALQSESISETASLIATLPSVRKFLMPVQRNAFSSSPLVAEGRDMGTVIFPEAELKIFVEVPVEIRAERRFQQLEAGDLLTTELYLERSREGIKNQIKSDILARDHRDQHRSLAPCIPAKDAIIFDNSLNSLTKAVDELYHLASRSLTG